VKVPSFSEDSIDSKLHPEKGTGIPVFGHGFYVFSQQSKSTMAYSPFEPCRKVGKIIPFMFHMKLEGRVFLRRKVLGLGE